MLSSRSLVQSQLFVRVAVAFLVISLFCFAVPRADAAPVESKSMVVESKALTQGATTNKISLTVKRPRAPRGATLNKSLQISGCWLNESFKSIAAKDAAKRTVKFRRTANGRALEFRKIKTLQFPLKITLTLTNPVSLVPKGSTVAAVGQTNCSKVRTKSGKLRDDCSAVQPVSVFGAFSGVACLNPADFEEQKAFGQIVFADGDEFSIRPRTQKLQFAMKDGSFKADLTDATVILNDVVYTTPDLQLVNGLLEVNAPLVDGRNTVKVLALDSEGLQAEGSFSFWAGSTSLTVLLRDESGAVVNAGEITLTLADDPDFYRVASFTGGQAIFENLPGTTVSVAAKAQDGRAGFSAGAGNDGTLTVTMLPVLEESSVDNNDISQGTSGWSIGSGANVSVVPHNEEQAASAPNVASDGGWTEIPNAAGDPDQDLVLQTSGQGPRFMTRTFRTDPRARLVRIRYRFQTSEFPGGYFGSRYNDFYNVALRSSRGARILDDGSSMNALGRGAFSPSGFTVWKSTVIPVNRGAQSQAGEVVQASVVVANVADGAYDSRVVVDKIEQSSFAITQANLYDLDNSPLRMISADSHSYFNGFTWINGTITLEGEKDDKVTEIYLQLMRGNTQVARAELSTQAAAKVLNKKFGTSGKLQIKMPMLLFKIFPNELSSLNSSEDRNFSLVIQARTADGQKAHTTVGSVDQLVRFAGAARYDGRDENVGGDDWVLPSVRSKVDALSGVTWGDFSNMNGGSFAPHDLHREGRSADGWVDGYNALDEGTADALINLLNSPAGRQIRFLYVRYNRSPSNRFYAAIAGRTLSNGRRVDRAILPDGQHGTHFHAEF